MANGEVVTVGRGQGRGNADVVAPLNCPGEISRTESNRRSQRARRDFKRAPLRPSRLSVPFWYL